MRKRTGQQVEAAEQAASAEKTMSGSEEAVNTGEVSLHPEVSSRVYVADWFAHTTDAMVTLNQRFQVLDCNAAALRKFSWSSASIPGHTCMELLKCRNLNGMPLCGTSSCPITRVMQLKRALANEEVLCETGDGKVSEFSFSITPLEVDGEHLVVVSARDESALKVANSLRSNFVSMVSHELRTPLNSVHGFIDLLMQGHMGELNEEQKTYLGYTQEGVQQLISIVEDILFLTRSDSGQFDVKQEKVNLLDIARQVLRGLKPQAMKASVILEKDIPTPSPLLYADPQRLKQVLNNLVGNAIKFTPPGGVVTVRARPYNEGFAMISVEDTGYGIAQEDRKHVFERFYQSNHSRQSKMGGYGLGLPIAKLIVEQHGGAIDFDSVVDHGTTFYFTAPLYQA